MIFFSKIIRTAELRSAGLIKGLTISNDDLNDKIKNAIEELFPCLKGKTWRFFRCKTTSDLEVANEPEIGWNAGALKMYSNYYKLLKFLFYLELKFTFYLIY